MFFSLGGRQTTLLLRSRHLLLPLPTNQNPLGVARFYAFDSRDLRSRRTIELIYFWYALRQVLGPWVARLVAFHLVVER